MIGRSMYIQEYHYSKGLTEPFSHIYLQFICDLNTSKFLVHDLEKKILVHDLEKKNPGA
jgi:hypothetical protein